MNIVPIGNNTFRVDKQDAVVVNIYDNNYTIAIPITEEEKEAFVKEDVPPSINGLPLTGNRILSFGSPFEVNDLDRFAENLLIDKIYTIPYKYDFNERTCENFITGSGREVFKWSECSRAEYYRYCISVLGNPDNIVIVKMHKNYYLNSECYANVKAKLNYTKPEKD